MIRGVVFDLDDTLYLERDYVRSGFRHVARVAAATEAQADELFAWLWAGFQDGTRGDTFDRLLEAFPDLAGAHSVADLVAAYRTHRPRIDLLPPAADVLANLHARSIRLGILSDGPIESQSAKVAALGVDRWCDPIVLTAAGPAGHAKPGTGGFVAIEAAWGLASAELAYVADNPSKDFIAPRALGWKAIRLRDPRQLRHLLEPGRPTAAPHIEIASLGELIAIVR